MTRSLIWCHYNNNDAPLTIKILAKNSRSVFIFMTLNIPVDNQGIPMALNNERFLLYRSNIEFEVRIDNLGKKELKGTVFPTAHRPSSPHIASSLSATSPRLTSGLSTSPLLLSTENQWSSPFSGPPTWRVAALPIKTFCQVYATSSCGSIMEAVIRSFAT